MQIIHCVTNCPDILELKTKFEEGKATIILILIVNSIVTYYLELQIQ